VRLQGAVSAGLHKVRSNVAQDIMEGKIEYRLRDRLWYLLYLHFRGIAMLNYEKMLICGFNTKHTEALDLVAIKPGHVVSIYWESRVQIDTTKVQYFFIQSLQEGLSLTNFLHIPRKPFHDVYPELYVNVLYNLTYFEILDLKFGQQCSIKPYKYRNGTLNSPIEMGLLTCHSMALSTSSAETLYYIFVMPYSWKIVYLNFKLLNQCQLDGKAIGLNITHILGFANMVIFSNLDQLPFALRAYGIPVCPPMARLNSCPFTLGPMVEIKIPPLKGKQCKFQLDMEKLPAGHVLAKKPFEDVSDNPILTIKNRQHHIIDMNPPFSGMSALSANEICQLENKSTALVYFSDFEKERIAAFLNDRRLHGSPVIVFTGWKVSNQVCSRYSKTNIVSLPLGCITTILKYEVLFFRKIIMKYCLISLVGDLNITELAISSHLVKDSRKTD